jgi:hypothetical protein
MAFVAISQRLREDVQNTISNKNRQELSLLQRPPAPVITANDPRVIKRFWGEHEHLRALMPQNWCTKVDNLYLRTEYPLDPAEPDNTRNLDVTPTVTGGPIWAPPKADTFYPRVALQADDPDIVEYVKVAQAEHQINAKWIKVRNDVLNFLNNCKSLNEALKLWPDVRIYIPQQYIDKAEEKTVKAKAAESRAMEVLKQIDTDHAVSSAVMVRILEANKQQEAQA